DSTIRKFSRPHKSDSQGEKRTSLLQVAKLCTVITSSGNSSLPCYMRTVLLSLNRPRDNEVSIDTIFVRSYIEICAIFSF
uniref:Uncharacterized protein n=1 Tax=Aegilops tauschii subsp. strangulata TaxID=200361 RepID=A0A453DYI3_AEGTS